MEFVLLGNSLVSTTTVGLIVTVLALLLCLYVRNGAKETSKKRPPSPPTLPVVGHLHLLSRYAENHWEGFNALRAQFGDIYSLALGAHKAVMVSSPELMREVLLTKGEIFSHRPHFNRYELIFGGDRENSLALCDWSDLQRFRRVVATLGILPRYGSKQFKCLDICIQLEVRESIERMLNTPRGLSLTLTKPDLLFTSANVFTNFLCSSRFSAEDEEHKKRLKDYDYVFYDINQCYLIDFLPFLAKLGFGSGYFKQVKNTCDDLRKYMEDSIVIPRLEILKSRSDEAGNGKRKRPQDMGYEFEEVPTGEDDRDFMDFVLQHHLDDPEQYPWTAALFEICDLVGGSSAVANLLMRLLGHLALDPEAQEIIYREAKEALDSDIHTCEEYVTLSHRVRMPFTEATILETLRIASSPIVPHVAAKDTTLQGYDIEEGTMIMFNCYYLNMSTKYWSDPTSFDPKRFLTDSSENNNKTWTVNKPDHFFPFSCGRRACLGYKLVNTITFSTVANLCLKFRLSPGDGNGEDIVSQLTPKGCLALPVEGCFKISLTPRE